MKGEYEDSLLEEINYDLSIFGDVLLDNKYHRSLIVKTLAKTPKNVTDKILREVIFIITSNGTFGTNFSLNITKPTTLNIILLNFTTFKQRDEELAIYTIAHEIAHFILGHRSGGAKREAEANCLVETWGFKRPNELGADQETDQEDS